MDITSGLISPLVFLQNQPPFMEMASESVFKPLISLLISSLYLLFIWIPSYSVSQVKNL